MRKCRFCGTQLKHEFIDLVNAPPSNSFLTKEQLDEPEVFYPLKLFVCEKCFLVQIDEYKKSGDIFGQDYAYYSSYSTTWLEHVHRYVDMIVNRFGYNSHSQVVEIASNDGYLLQYFLPKKIPVLGIEPSENVARVAQKKGVETIVEFFGMSLAEKLVVSNKAADLIIGNNVLAHVPNINDFVAGMKRLLKRNGIITLEFPHLMKLIECNQFDTIYHEHFSYFSFRTVRCIFENHGLEIFDVEQISTHGGSLRIYGKHKEDPEKAILPSVNSLIDEEKARGMQSIRYYEDFQKKVDKIKYDLVNVLMEQKKQEKKVIAYGAAAKGNTLLNYCGIKNDLIEYVVDASPQKQGKFMPGSHIPVVNEKCIKETKPDLVLILPWNIRTEVISQLNYIRQWGGKFVIPIPVIQVL